MINREVTYERTLTGSFLKVPAAIQADFDEKMMLKHKLAGMLPVEKCFFNNQGQYWYNITGMQSLDTYCNVHEVPFSMIEKLMIGICDEVELLEWNLMAPESLLFDPEYIFLSNSNQEFLFMIYPGTKGDAIAQLRQLMEFLLTRINHKDETEVQKAYGFYETLLNGTNSVAEIRSSIIRSREEALRAEVEFEEAQKRSAAGSDKSGFRWKTKPPAEEKSGKPEKGGAPGKANGQEKRSPEQMLEDWKEAIRMRMAEWLAEIRERLFGSRARKERKKQEAKVYQVQPEEYDYYEAKREESRQKEVFPTVCIGAGSIRPEGILLYEGAEGFRDIILGNGETKIGQGEQMQARIEKETISHMHAKITNEVDGFYLEDLNSTNGTYLNDKLLSYKEKRLLKGNDLIRFADVKYRFV